MPNGWGVACCPRCAGDVPLISTFAFYKAEFYCLDCGGRFGFLSPNRPEHPGAELDARLAAYEAEWEEHAGRKLLGAFWLTDCERCDGLGEYHPAHATALELAAHATAEAWLIERRKVAA